MSNKGIPWLGKMTWIIASLSEEQTGKTSSGGGFVQDLGPSKGHARGTVAVKLGTIGNGQPERPIVHRDQICCPRVGNACSRDSRSALSTLKGCMSNRPQLVVGLFSDLARLHRDGEDQS